MQGVPKKLVWNAFFLEKNRKLTKIMKIIIFVTRFCRWYGSLSFFLYSPWPRACKLLGVAQYTFINTYYKIPTQIQTSLVNIEMWTNWKLYIYRGKYLGFYDVYDYFLARENYETMFCFTICFERHITDNTKTFIYSFNKVFQSPFSIANNIAKF